MLKYCRTRYSLEVTQDDAPLVQAVPVFDRHEVRIMFEAGKATTHEVNQALKMYWPTLKPIGSRYTGDEQ